MSGHFKCCNYDHCGQSFATIEERERHETFCQVPPPPDPPQSSDDQQKAG